MDKAEKMSKEALIAAEAEAEEKQAAAEETPEEENKAEENTAEPDALQTKEEELPVVPAALQESMTQDGDEKTEDNAPVSLLPAGNKEVSPADDAQAADTGAPQPLFSIPDEADKETQPTELLPEKPVSDEQTEQDKSPGYGRPARQSVNYRQINLPRKINTLRTMNFRSSRPYPKMKLLKMISLLTQTRQPIWKLN